jgi:DNA-nicking Smr family endonuclease
MPLSQDLLAAPSVPRSPPWARRPPRRLVVASWNMTVAGRVRRVRVRLKLDLHDIYNRGTDIDRALSEVIDEAERIRAKTVEIIPGKGSGQLKKRVLRFLDRKDIKARYHRVEKDSKNFGRVFVHFKH